MSGFASTRLRLPLLMISLLVCSVAQALQFSDGRIRSEHVRVKIPSEREWLGREAISGLEECWRYVDRVTGGKLPRMILVEVNWESAESKVNFEANSISIGMAHPGAAKDRKRYLLLRAAREMARLGLAELSRGGSRREESQFVSEGMAEILACEYDLSTKSLASAWVIAHFLSRSRPLSLEILSSWTQYSAGRRDLTAAAPGITFLLTCRELYGRDRTLKLFEALRKGGLKEALSSAFRSSPAMIEQVWLERIRQYKPPESLTVTYEEDVPELTGTEFASEESGPDGNLRMLLHIRDAGGNLNPRSVFVVDHASGAVFQGREPAESGAKYVVVELPVGGKEKSSRTLSVIAVDDSGNFKSWQGTHTQEP